MKQRKCQAMRCVRGGSVLMILFCLGSRVSGLDGELFGLSVSGIGDVDGDDIPDILVGDPGYRGDHVGRAWVLSGASAEPLFRVLGDTIDDEFGITVEGPGDLNGDSLPDFLVGAAKSQEADQGYVRAFSGTGEELYTIPVSADDLKRAWYSVGAGPVLCGLPDLNGDGCVEFAIGSAFDDTRAENAGAVRIFSGRDGSPLHALFGESANDLFGSSLACAESRSGVSILLVGAIPKGGTNSTHRRGYAKAFSLGSEPLHVHTICPEDASRWFGFAVSIPGDLNSDGISDYLVGEPTWLRSFPSIHRGVRAFSGKDGSEFRTWNPRTHGAFGAIIGAIEDVNNDNVPDFLVSAPVTFTKEGGPYFWAMSGKEDKVIHSLRHGGDWDTGFGVSTDSLGDLDDDGVDDFVVGAAHVRSSFDGAVQVHSGRTGKLIHRVKRYDLVAIKENR